jgi:ABC-type antimicrobial peptide transport system permease subunit
MILAEGATDEVFSRLPPLGPEELPQDLQQAIAKDNGKFLVSAEVYVIVNQVIAHPKPGGPFRRLVQMRGIKDPVVSAQVHRLELKEGKWLSPTGVRKVSALADGQDTAKEAVLGEGIAQVMGNDIKGEPLRPGDVISIGPHWWVVTGIMKSEGSTYGSEVWARDTIVGETFGRKNSYSTYVARTASDAIARKAAKVLKTEKVQGTTFQAYTEREYFEKISQTNQQFSVAIFFVAIVMAIGGALGVMNTMFAAINQRAKDIGVLRLLGYTRGQILVSFLLESVVLALLGGLLGCALGFLIEGQTASSIVSSGQGGGGKSVVLRLIVDGNILAMALLFTLAMGLVGGFFPSLSAMRLRPLESLK